MAPSETGPIIIHHDVRDIGTLPVFPAAAMHTEDHMPERLTSCDDLRPRDSAAALCRLGG